MQSCDNSHFLYREYHCRNLCLYPPRQDLRSFNAGKMYQQLGYVYCDCHGEYGLRSGYFPPADERYNSS